MKIKLIKLVLFLLVIVAAFKVVITIYNEALKDKEDPLTPHLIANENFSVNTNKDTVLISQKGTIIILKRNIFYDCNSKSIKGNITISLKEVFSGSDIAISGIATMANRKILESGGMICLNAYKENKLLCLKDNSHIGIIMKNETGNDKMHVFKGKKINKILDWRNPSPVISNTLFIKKSEKELQWQKMDDSIPEELGLLKTNLDRRIYDSLIQAYKLEDQFRQDLYTVFEANELGWMNIDRFANEYKTDNVNFTVKIYNRPKYKNVFVRMIFVDKKIQLSGLELNNGKFIFGKTGSSEVNLPLGQKIIIIVTSFHKSKPFIGISEIKIEKNQNIFLKLEESSIEKIKEIIRNKI